MFTQSRNVVFRLLVVIAGGGGGGKEGNVRLFYSQPNVKSIDSFRPMKSSWINESLLLLPAGNTPTEID
jgi:hypothetical protein